MDNRTVEILTIGNEVLAGNVLDTNSHWLCQQLAALGAEVRRITVLPDDPSQIGEGLRGALSRAPRLIITCGGLGPTSDDLTVAAIGAALGLPVSENPAAYAMIHDFYGELARRGHVDSDEMLPAARKDGADAPRRGAAPKRGGRGAGRVARPRRDAPSCLCPAFRPR